MCIGDFCLFSSVDSLEFSSIRDIFLTCNLKSDAFWPVSEVIVLPISGGDVICFPLLLKVTFWLFLKVCGSFSDDLLSEIVFYSANFLFKIYAVFSPYNSSGSSKNSPVYLCIESWLAAELNSNGPFKKLVPGDFWSIGLSIWFRDGLCRVLDCWWCLDECFCWASRRPCSKRLGPTFLFFEELPLPFFPDELYFYCGLILFLYGLNLAVYF